MRRLACLMLFVATALLPAPAGAGPTVTGILVSAGSSDTRVVLELSEPVEYRQFILHNPERLVLDLPELRWRATIPALPANALLRDIRHGVFQPGISRIVLDLAGPARVTRVAVEAANDRSSRLVIELGDEPASLAASGPPAGLVGQAAAAPGPPSPTRAVARRAATKPVIVIDPGHGGADPGAITEDGRYEKDLTLAMARALKGKLEARGRYRVILTRDDDVSVRLRDRVETARAAGAALFISLHADSMERPHIRGLSVYTLSERASDAEAEALARRENKADLIAGLDLSEENKQVVNILIDLTQRETKNLSAQYAQLLVAELGKQTVLLAKPHRFAGFAVLKAADVPSVLVELGYLSNATDAKLLGQDAHRGRLGEAIARAVDAFFASRAVAGRL